MSHEPAAPSNDTIVFTDVEKLDDAVDVERLGKERPPAFKTWWQEVIFVLCVLGVLSMGDFIIGGFQVVLPLVIEPLDIPPGSQIWPTTVLILVGGAFLFPLGRVTDMFGGYVVFHAGAVWFMAWNIAAGFSKDFILLTVCRALQGLGAAAFLPAGISLIGRIYRPGPRKNFIFGLYGSLAPIGFFAGIMVGGLAEDLLSWRWYFYLGGIFVAVFLIGSSLTAPFDYHEARQMNVKMDWYGTLTTVPGMMLLIYAISFGSSAPQGWKTPYIVITLILGVLFLAAAVYVEGWVAEVPIIPADMFKVKYMKRMLVNLFLIWGAFNIYLVYSNFYIETILKQTPLLASAYFAPWAIGGCILATASGFLLHRIPGRILMVFSASMMVIAVLLFAIIPDHPSYWRWILPAMLTEAACSDVMWTVSNVYLTTSLPKNRQGLAGAIICFSLWMGGAFFLAITDTLKSHLAANNVSEKNQYKSLFWFAVGLAALALVICCFLNIDKASSGLTVDEAEAEQRKNSTPASTAETDVGSEKKEPVVTVEELGGVVVDSDDETQVPSTPNTLNDDDKSMV